MKQKIFILDTSAILSGKPFDFNLGRFVTTPLVESELKPGGRDYRNFQYFLEQGLIINAPSKASLDKINTISTETGDYNRLSDADKEILALAYEINKDGESEAIIFTDDYSIQNVASTLNIKFQTFAQHGITKKFKWSFRCSGCGKKFKEKKMEICPICGASMKSIVTSTKDIRKK